MGQTPKGTLRQAQKQGSRRLILESAYALFSEKGYEASTMRMLAVRAGVSLGAIFSHFPDKPSLLAAAFQEDLDAVVQEAFRSLPPVGYAAQLLRLTREIYGFYARDAGLARTLVSQSLFLPGEPGARLDAQLAAFLDAVAALLAAARERGELPRSFSSELGAIAFGSLYLGVLIQGLKEEVFDVEARIALLGALLEQHFPSGSSASPPLSQSQPEGGSV
jgi:AcrR family transcriptional regulator